MKVRCQIRSFYFTAANDVTLTFLGGNFKHQYLPHYAKFLSKNLQTWSVEPTEHFGIYFGYIRRLFQSWVSPFKTFWTRRVHLPQTRERLPDAAEDSFQTFCTGRLQLPQARERLPDAAEDVRQARADRLSGSQPPEQHRVHRQQDLDRGVVPQHPPGPASDQLLRGSVLWRRWSCAWWCWRWCRC